MLVLDGVCGAAEPGETDEAERPRFLPLLGRVTESAELCVAGRVHHRMVRRPFEGETGAMSHKSQRHRIRGAHGGFSSVHAEATRPAFASARVLRTHDERMRFELRRPRPSAERPVVLDGQAFS